MKLSFNLEDIIYLKLEYNNDGRDEIIKLALKDKVENEFIAVAPKAMVAGVKTPQKVNFDFICHNGIYKTQTMLNSITIEGDYAYLALENPDTLDYQQNREYYRILAEYDCIYTVDDGYETKTYTATTYDISAGGVSIIMSENVISQEEMSIIIATPEREVKSHIKFVRCEAYEGDYKLSFEFTDLSERDYKLLSDLCVNKQLSGT